VLDLRLATPPSWLDVVFSDFDAFLLDHAACERKASATGMSFVAHYPDRTALLEPMIELAREELEHFHRVFRLCAARGLRLGRDYQDPYVNGLRRLVRPASEPRLLDRLLVAGIVEARGCERLQLVADALFDPARGAWAEHGETYRDLARAESRHHALFFRLARCFFDEATVRERAAVLLDAEAELVARLPHRPAVH
jgi:tRNA-(ms[2]io[6]A)-hydroxylase